jgi:hypothetical protein
MFILGNFAKKLYEEQGHLARFVSPLRYESRHLIIEGSSELVRILLNAKCMRSKAHDPCCLSASYKYGQYSEDLSGMITDFYFGGDAGTVQYRPIQQET